MSSVATPSGTRQATIAEFWGTPGTGPSHPVMETAAIKEFQKTAPDPPYPVPFDDGVSEHAARNWHRTFYWLTHDFWAFECPDCERSREDVYGVDVHHIDEDPRNGDPDNLVALCQRCHQWRHAESQNISALDVDEWKTAFRGISR